jgi:hypothetical protein
MKKTLLPIIASLMLAIPLQAFASVNFTLEEDTMSTSKSFTVSVDTETDLLETLDFTIEYAEGVDITSVKDHSGVCSTLRSVSQENKLNIVCTLSEATSLNGVVATVTFDAPNSQYNFTILEDESMDLGTLELGEVENIEHEVLAETDDTVTTTTTSTDGTSTTEETTTPTTTDSTSPTDTTTIGTTESSTSSTENLSSTITDYLPWILLAGAAILLISILAIVFSGKKDKSENKEENPTKSISDTLNLKPEQETETKVKEKKEEVPSPSEKAMTDNPPTDIENISDSLYTPQLNKAAIEEKKANPAPVEMQVQETPTEQPVVEEAPVQETPVEQPVTPTPIEASTPPVETTPVTELTTPATPVSEPMPVTPEAPTQPSMPPVSGPVANLQGDNQPKDEQADLAALNSAAPVSNPAPVNPSPMQENNLSSFNTTEPAPPTAVSEPVPAVAMPTTPEAPKPEPQSGAPMDYLNPQPATPDTPVQPVTPVTPAPAQTEEDTVAMPDIPPVM